MRKKTSAKDILDRYRSGDITPRERILLERWWLTYGTDGTVDLSDEDEDRIARDMAALIKRRTRSRSQKIRLWTYGGVAATIVLGMVVGLWQFGLWNADGLQHRQEASTVTIMPGTNRATLTLADGTTVDLNEAQTGIVVSDGITYSDGTALVDDLQIPLAAPDARPVQLMLSTPRGGQYQITLPDGTEVWLNAASTLTYPMHFADNERVVKLEGEAYFSVKGADKKPFIVRTPENDIEVLGTEFNVMVYPEEPAAKTTLVSGALKVVAKPDNGGSLETNRTSSVTLVPGQQASWHHGRLHTRTVDVESEVAWKKGYFTFENEHIRSIMRKAARWYDHLEVEYEGPLPNRRFNGGIPRNASLNEFLQVLEMNNIQFEHKGNKITIK